MSSSTNLFAVLSLLLATTNSSADDLFDMLKRMSEADQNHNYQGTFILRKSDELSTLHVTHGVDNKGIWESLESLSGEKKKVIRHNKEVVSIFPEREIITIRHMDEKRSLHSQTPDNMDRLPLFYSMQRLDDDRIADHPTLVVDLIPNDQYRYGYRYWVDKNTGMLLRYDLLDENRTVVEQMMFTTLDYLSETPAEAFDLQQYERYQLKRLSDSETHGQPVPQRWTVNRLPKGFMLTQIIERQSQSQLVANSQTVATESAAGLLHMVYSDGLASVSVFIEKNMGVGRHLQGASSMGAVNAYGNAVGGYVVTVVGEVPASTVRAMAQSTVQLSSTMQPALSEVSK